MSTPDVTVSLAVYNTMPYLRETLDSLVGQSIGHDRLEVVAVDDGSTDGSGELLDEYAAAHPTVFRVIHQPNSGGPAGPCNRALEVATGRFVYFLGADDYLGQEALERMVGYADEHDADVVMGRVVGVNGREIRQGVFRRNEPDLDRYGPDLRWSLANTSLYRRSLVERLGLRYVEGLPFGSDQPFMLEAVVHASRIAVLADYTCYYAVDRHEMTNISYSTPYAERLRCIEVLVETAARLVPAGTARDTVLVRHFTWEVPSLLRQGFRDLPETFREKVCADVASFLERYGNDAILDDLRVVPRVLLRLAQRGEVDLLTAMLEAPDDEHATLLAGADGVYVEYPGFSADPPDPTYRLPDGKALRDRMTQALETVDATWEGRGTHRRLVVEVATNLRDPDGHTAVGALLRRRRDAYPVEDVVVVTGQTGATVVVAADLRGLPETGPDGAGWKLRLTVAVGGHDVEVAVPAPADVPGRVRFVRDRGVGTAWVEPGPGQLVVRVSRVPMKHAVRAVARRVSRRRG